MHNRLVFDAKNAWSMNLNQLEHLLALNETRHFARAADKVFLSQPAFSRSIQALERQTNLVLFERKGGEIRPTPAGEFLIERAKRLLLEARSIKREVLLYQQGEVGDLAFGVGPFPSVTLAPAVVSSLRRDYSNVSVRLEVASPSKLLSLLQKEEIEFFVADTGELQFAPYLHCTPLIRQYGMLYVRIGHHLAGKQCTFQEVWAYGLASVKLPEQVKLGLFNLLGNESSVNAPQVALECDDIHLLHGIGSNTDTVVASTELAAKPWVDSGVLIALEVVDFPPVYSQFTVVRLSGRTLSPVAVHAIAMFEQAVGLKTLS